MLTEILMRLRQQVPLVQRRVFGSALYDKADLDNEGYATPYLVVIPTAEDPKQVLGNGETYEITSTFTILVTVNNEKGREDGSGLHGYFGVEAIRKQILGGLLGWEPYMWKTSQPTVTPGFEDLAPNSRAASMRYNGGQIVKKTDSMLWYAYEFETSFIESRQCQPAVLTYMRPVTVTGGMACLPLEQGADPATITITRVVHLGTDTPISSRRYTLDLATGCLTFPNGDAVDGDKVFVAFTVAQPSVDPTLLTLYAQYYPELLDLAGGDPANITSEMFTAIGQPPLLDGSQ